MPDLSPAPSVALGYGTVVADTGIAIRVELTNKSGDSYLLWIPKACLHENERSRLGLLEPFFVRPPTEHVHFAFVFGFVHLRVHSASIDATDAIGTFLRALQRKTAVAPS